jgi:hypothetical protein
LKPTNFQLKVLAMSSYEDASYFMEVQEALKGDPFVEKIRERLYINEINNEFEFQGWIALFQGTFVYISKAYTTQDNSSLPQSTCGWTFWLQQNHGIDIKRFLVPQMWKLVKEFIQSCDTCTCGRFHDIDHMASFIYSWFQRIPSYYY